MIAYSDASVTIGGRKILESVSFKLERGEKAVVYGPTGSGKTVLLLALLGAYELSSGSILFEGRPLTSRHIPTVRRSVAYIGQEPVLGEATVRDALLLPFSFAANRSLTPNDSRIEEVCASLRLDKTLLDQNTAVISGGEKQRVAIARAILLGKNVFLADEVTSALDAESSAVVMELFMESRYTVLAVSHDAEWHRSFGTQIPMRAGRITR